MVDGRVPRHKIQDPPGQRYWPVYKGRDGCRTPMQWDGSTHAGFSSATPWLAVNPDYRSRNRASQRTDPTSVLETYRAALALRRVTPALRHGTMTLPDEDHPQVLTWLRALDDTQVRVVVNMSTERVSYKLEGERVAEVLLGTHCGGEVAVGQRLDLRPHEGLLILLD